MKKNNPYTLPDVYNVRDLTTSQIYVKIGGIVSNLDSYKNVSIAFEAVKDVYNKEYFDNVSVNNIDFSRLLAKALYDYFPMYNSFWTKYL